MNELHDYDINFWIGVGDVLHVARMEQYPNRDVAVVAGVDQLMTWAQSDPDFPQDAVGFWFASKNNTSLTFQDVQAELEARWGIQFGAKQVDNAPPPPPKPKADKLSKQAKPANLDIIDTDDLDITALLKQRATTLTERYKRLTTEVAAKQRLLDETERAIDNIHVMLLAAASSAKEANGHSKGRKRADQARGKELRETKQARHRRPRRDEGRAGGGIDAGSGSAGNSVGGIAYQAK